jgi:hypothetical protein
MARPYGLGLAALLFASSLSMAATKDNERPDKEMLQMMDFLREMEMIRQMDMMQDMPNVEYAGDQLKGTSPQKPPPKKKETAR